MNEPQHITRMSHKQRCRPSSLAARAGLPRDAHDLLCPPGFIGGVLNVVMTQRWASCQQLIQAGEILRGKKYQIVMRWRPDIRPLTHFPPLADPVWASFPAKTIIIPGFLRYFGSTAAQVPLCPPPPRSLHPLNF